MWRVVLYVVEVMGAVCSLGLAVVCLWAGAWLAAGFLVLMALALLVAATETVMPLR